LAAALIGIASLAQAANLDERGDIKLGARAYVNARVGTEHTDVVIKENAQGNQTFRSLTFPVSADGHLRQNRFFVEADFDHDLMRLMRDGFGPLELLKDLPFRIKRLKYHLTYRYEGEGIYDWGPSEYRNANPQYFDRDLVPIVSGNVPDSGAVRRRLRKFATQRHRLYQAYLETQFGDLFMRVGRQILVWGETDAFRLLDNINPVDNSFGGFLISLDERRVPLDMLVLNYYLADFWGHAPIYEAYVEGFVAVDDAVAFAPGIPQGSAWQLPNLSAPSAVLATQRHDPARNFNDARGGAQFKFNAPVPVVEEATFGLAHYYTYLDIPQVQTFTPPNFVFGGSIDGALAVADQTAPRVQITGATTTFAVPSSYSRLIGLSGEPVIRMELAYFRGEPRFSQQMLDPFIYATVGGCSGPSGTLTMRQGEEVCTSSSRRRGDSWNFVLGVDTNQWIRFLNPRQSFFISTQFFYKHLNGAVKRGVVTNRNVVDPETGKTRQCTPDVDPGCIVLGPNGEVLPVPEFGQESPQLPGAGAGNSILIHNPVDQYLQTLLIATSYFSGQVTPSLTLFYDWSGGFVAIPQVLFSRDPFRFIISYNYLIASRLKGASGVSLLRDRDNLLFQVEYVI
jgi:hypothetical protein